MRRTRRHSRDQATHAARPFPRAESTSSPVPLDEGCSRFTTSPVGSHWQALGSTVPLRLSWLSFPLAGRLNRSPRAVTLAAWPVTGSGAPHASRVERTRSHARPSPNPTDGITHVPGLCPVAAGRPAPPHPLCTDTAFSHRLLSRRSFRVAQIRKAPWCGEGLSQMFWPNSPTSLRIGSNHGTTRSLRPSIQEKRRWCVWATNPAAREADYSVKPPSRYRVYSRSSPIRAT